MNSLPLSIAIKLLDEAQIPYTKIPNGVQFSGLDTSHLERRTNMRVSSLVKNTEFLELRPGEVFSYHSEFYMKIPPIYYSYSCSNDEFESEANAIKLSNGELSVFAESAIVHKETKILLEET